MGEAAEIISDDAFELAFEAAAIADESGEPIVDEPAVEAPVAEEPAPVEEPAAEPSEPEEKPEETPSEPVAEDPPAPKPPEPVVPTPEEVQATKEAEQKAEEERVAAEAARKQATEEALARENYTEEEQALINQVSTDYSEVSKALAAQHRVLSAKFENVLNSKLEELSTQFEQRLATTAATTEQIAAQNAEQTLLKVHPDAYDIHPQVMEWIQSKPSIFRGPLEQITKTGTSTDVIEMLNMYKSETGAQGKPEPTAEEKAAKAAEEKKKEEKLQAQEGVRAKSATSKTAIDPDDFDGAFEKFATTA